MKEIAIDPSDYEAIAREHDGDENDGNASSGQFPEIFFTLAFVYTRGEIVARGTRQITSSKRGENRTRGRRSARSPLFSNGIAKGYLLSRCCRWNSSRRTIITDVNFSFVGLGRPHLNAKYGTLYYTHISIHLLKSVK